MSVSGPAPPPARRRRPRRRSSGVAGVILAWRAAQHAPPAWAAGTGLLVLCALLTIGGEWASLGIVAGIPLQAATCLLLGLAAAGAATVEEDVFV